MNTIRKKAKMKNFEKKRWSGDMVKRYHSLQFGIILLDGFWGNRFYGRRTPAWGQELCCAVAHYIGSVKICVALSWDTHKQIADGRTWLCQRRDILELQLILLPVLILRIPCRNKRPRGLNDLVDFFVRWNQHRFVESFNLVLFGLAARHLTKGIC